jgi:hypothetical protein
VFSLERQMGLDGFHDGLRVAREPLELYLDHIRREFDRRQATSERGGPRGRPKGLASDRHPGVPTGARQGTDVANPWLHAHLICGAAPSGAIKAYRDHLVTASRKSPGLADSHTSGVLGQARSDGRDHRDAEGRRREFEEFFVNYHRLGGKQFRIIALKGPTAGRRLIKRARKHTS